MKHCPLSSTPAGTPEDPTMAMDHDSSHFVSYIPSTQNHGPWMDGSGYHAQHQSPVNDYGSFAAFGSPDQNGQQPPYMHGQRVPPPPLITHQWPSMIANQSQYPPQHTMQPHPNAAAIPIQLNSSSSSHHHTPTPRRTLTDADRRRMCLYHEEHPGKKQTEIGEIFGVERSTVSKVLRQKEKYLSSAPDSSPLTKNRPGGKGKFPDVERALMNWAKNQEGKGVKLTDDMIREQARFFSATVGGAELQAKLTSQSWLEKFKQKYGLMGAKETRSRRGSTAPDLTDDSPRARSSRGSMATPKEEDSPIFTPDSADGPHAFFPASSPQSSASTLTLQPGARHRSSTFPVPIPGADSYISPSPSSQHATPHMAAAQPQGHHQHQHQHQHLDSPLEPHSAVSSVPTPGFRSLSHAHAPSSSASPTSPATTHSTYASSSHSHHGANSLSASTSLSSMTNASSNKHLLPPPTPRELFAASAGGAPAPSSDEARRALEVVWTYLHQQQLHEQAGAAIDPTEIRTVDNLMEKMRMGSIGTNSMPAVNLSPARNAGGSPRPAVGHAHSSSLSRIPEC